MTEIRFSSRNGTARDHGVLFRRCLRSTSLGTAKARALRERQLRSLQDYAWRFQDVCAGIGGVGDLDGDRSMPQVLQVQREQVWVP